MKHFAAALTLVVVCSVSQTAQAQAAGSWVSVSPAGEQFTVQMPQIPTAKTQKNRFEQFNLEGHVFTAAGDGVEYTVWSLKNQAFESIHLPEGESYLDACADLVWEGLLKPLRDMVPKEAQRRTQMIYQRELHTDELWGREYNLMIGKTPGLVHFFSEGNQIYILTVLNADAGDADTQRFVKSFGPQRPKLPAAMTGPNSKEAPSAGIGSSQGGGMGVGPGSGGGTGNGTGVRGNANAETDYNRTFNSRDVTQKARVFSKAEPHYTESARKYGVQGTVIMRVALSKEETVTNIHIVSRLPHGLTEQAIEAARQIKFTPATKDGHAVAQWAELQFSFNLY